GDAHPWTERLAAALGREHRAGSTAIDAKRHRECEAGRSDHDLTTGQNLAARGTPVQGFNCDMLGHGSDLPRRALAGAHDALTVARAAIVRVLGLDVLVGRGLGFLLEQASRANDLPGLPVAALRPLPGEPGLLQRVR